MEPTREANLPEKKRIKIAYIPILFLGFLLFLAAALSASDYFYSYGRIHRGVSVSGISVGEMTPAEARRELYSQSPSILDSTLVVNYGNRSWKISPRNLNASLDFEGTLNDAYRVGRQGSLLEQMKERFLLWQRPREIQLRFSLNQRKLRDFIAEIRTDVEVRPRDARIVARKGTVSVLPSREGLEVRENELNQLLLAKLPHPANHYILLPTNRLPVRIATEEAEMTLQEVRRMLAGPLTLRWGHNRWVLTPDNLSNLLGFREERERTAGSGFESRLRPCLDRERTQDLLQNLTSKISVPAQDAGFEIIGDKVNIIPSKDGFEVDKSASLPLMEEALRSPEREAAVVMSKTSPQRTTEAAASMGIKEKISTFTTTFDPRATPRVHNIRLLASALDGAIVAPGDVFSFNQTVGPRTAAKGYQEAPTIVKGELVPTLGGGVCQVGTTFFNTIFFAGLEIVERNNHSFYISHYPAGRDATVSYGGADLKFRNDTPNYLLVKTASTPSSLTISLYGTNPHREVTFTTSPFSNFVPSENKFVPDPTLPKDQQKIQENGVTGRHITVVRTVREGERIVHRDKFVSHYNPKKAVVKVGTGEAVAQAPTTLTTGAQASPPLPEVGAPPSTGQQPAPDNSPPQQSTPGNQ